MKATDAAYLAAIIDGEGSVTMSKNMNHGKSHLLPYHNPGICIYSNNNEFLESLRDTIGGLGVIRIHSRRNSTNLQKKDVYVWDIRGGKQIRALLKIVRPYMRLKKKQVEVLIDYYKTVREARGGRGPVPQDLYEEREQMWLEMRKLNAR